MGKESNVKVTKTGSGLTNTLMGRHGTKVTGTDKKTGKETTGYGWTTKQAQSDYDKKRSK